MNLYPVFREIPTGIKLLSDQLHRAIHHKDHETLAQLLSKENNFHVLNNNCFDTSLLDLAVSEGDEISVKLLLDHGAIPDYERPIHVWPQSTLSRAIRSGNLKVVQLLVNHGCDPDTNLECTMQRPIFFPYNYWYAIVEENNLPIFQYLWESKDRISGNVESNQKILLTAFVRSKSITEYLLSQGLSIESSNEKGWTGIFHAVANLNVSLVRMLISRGANLKHKDFEGRNLLHITAYHYNFKYAEDMRESVKLLIESGLDINATDNKGLTPLNAALCACPYWPPDIILLYLKQPNINLAQPDNDGITVLHRALRLNKEIFWALLCKLDVININARDKDNRTPLQLIDKRHWDYFVWLLDFGADTSVLHELTGDMLENEYFYKILLKKFQLKREIAGFSKDQNIEILVDPHSFVYPMRKCIPEEYFKEVERMKETILCDQLTYYDFLHAKKRTCINVAKRPGISENFKQNGYQFPNYNNMLVKKYLSGARPLTPIESEAMILADENLDLITNNNLPNLVIYNINKYIEIEDLITLNNIVLKYTSNKK